MIKDIHFSISTDRIPRLGDVSFSACTESTRLQGYNIELVMHVGVAGKFRRLMTHVKHR